MHLPHEFPFSFAYLKILEEILIVSLSNDIFGWNDQKSYMFCDFGEYPLADDIF